MAVQSVPSLMGITKAPYASFSGKTEVVARAGLLDDVTTIDDITTITVWLLFLRGVF